MTKAHAYSCLVDDLNTYYQLSGIEDVDTMYLKSLKRKSTKKVLLQKENMKKMVEILFDSPQNRLIKNTIK